MEEGAETGDSAMAEDIHTTRAGLPLALPTFARNQEYGVGVPEKPGARAHSVPTEEKVLPR